MLGESLSDGNLNILVVRLLTTSILSVSSPWTIVAKIFLTAPEVRLWVWHSFEIV